MTMPTQDRGDPPLRQDAYVRLSLSDFESEDANVFDRVTSRALVTAFNDIEPQMLPSLASQLAEFVQRTWKEVVADQGDGRTIRDMHSALAGSGERAKRLYYPYWFYLAIHWGPNNGRLTVAREDMSALWGVAFPVHKIFYPDGIPLGQEKRLFYGINAADDGDDDATDASDGVEEQVRSLERLIKSVPPMDVTQVLASELLSPVTPCGRTAELEIWLSKVRDDLQDTRADLQESQNQLAGVDDRFTPTEDHYELRDTVAFQEGEIATLQDELKRMGEELRQARDETKVLEKRMDKELAEARDKADKAVRVCALLMSILKSSSGEKRKHDSEDDEGRE